MMNVSMNLVGSSAEDITTYMFIYLILMSVYQFITRLIDRKWTDTVLAELKIAERLQG